MFGYPITDLFADRVEDSWTGPVQWFERDRLEDHTNERLRMMAGRLGATMLEIQDRPWEQVPQVTSAPDGCRYVPAA
ncbi:MAG: hypothetical protein HGA19_21910 [Oscillochloris sp.]|nr:hypothetical protein [Oscillochloris sp.]